jgi:hypothetical protein
MSISELSLLDMSASTVDLLLRASAVGLDLCLHGDTCPEVTYREYGAVVDAMQQLFEPEVQRQGAVKTSYHRNAGIVFGAFPPFLFPPARLRARCEMRDTRRKMAVGMRRHLPRPRNAHSRS